MDEDTKKISKEFFKKMYEELNNCYVTDNSKSQNKRDTLKLSHGGVSANDRKSVSAQSVTS